MDIDLFDSIIHQIQCNIEQQNNRQKFLGEKFMRCCWEALKERKTVHSKLRMRGRSIQVIIIWINKMDRITIMGQWSHVS